MKKNIIIGLLLVMNVFLVYRINKSQVNKSQIIQTKISVLHPELINANYQNELVVILPEISCITCLRNEIGLLNRVEKQNVLFYFYGQNKDFLKNEGALFDYEIISDKYPLLSGVLSDNPIAIKFESAEITEMHKAIVNNKQASEDFYVKYGLLTQ